MLHKAYTEPLSHTPLHRRTLINIKDPQQQEDVISGGLNSFGILGLSYLSSMTLDAPLDWAVVFSLVLLFSHSLVLSITRMLERCLFLRLAMPCRKNLNFNFKSQLLERHRRKNFLKRCLIPLGPALRGVLVFCPRSFLSKSIPSHRIPNPSNN